MKSFIVKGPFESRKAAENLRDQLIEYLSQINAPIGTPFFSDAELMEMSGLSRKTVRKALSELHRQGWIERHPGKGTFLGVRSTMPLAPRQRVDASKRAIVRLAILVHCMADLMPDWYSQGVLGGLDEAAYEEGISIELLGNYTQDADILSRRLLQSQPDILLVMPATSRHVYLVGEAQRQGIPCMLTGMRLADLPLPTVCEDNLQGAELAVRHLYENGHRRIGLLQRPDTAAWVFERRQGYVEALHKFGLEHDERLVWWQPPDQEQALASLKDWWRTFRPTAILASNGLSLELLGQLHKQGTLRVPKDVSVATFDQCYLDYRQYFDIKVTTVELPLRQMGRTLSRLARKIIDTGSPLQHEFIRIDCEFVEGETVLPLTDTSS